MMYKMKISALVAGLFCGYIAILYALVHVLVLINHAYVLSLAM